ncbi:MAG TPA: hypothetical protein PK156_10780 [Polyangium sp.]|nr:hypothetical protein [Polyangium sp.]
MNEVDAGCQELCLSEMHDITNSGLVGLKRFENLERLWLDDMDGITGDGIEALCAIPKLKRLSICSKSSAFQPNQFVVLNGAPRLRELFVDPNLLKRSSKRPCQTSRFVAAEVRRTVSACGKRMQIGY